MIQEKTSQSLPAFSCMQLLNYLSSCFYLLCEQILKTLKLSNINPTKGGGGVCSVALPVPLPVPIHLAKIQKRCAVHCVWPGE